MTHIDYRIVCLEIENDRLRSENELMQFALELCAEEHVSDEKQIIFGDSLHREAIARATLATIRRARRF